MAQDRPRISKRYAAFVGNPDNYSGRVNSIIGRYQSIVTAGMPELTEGEWLAICDANNGTVFPGPDESTAIDPARYAWMNVADSNPAHYQEQFGVDNIALARAMKNMNFIQQCGIIEVVLSFWEKTDRQFDNYTEMLTACGAKIKK